MSPQRGIAAPGGWAEPAWFSFQAPAQGNHHAMSHALTYEQAAAILNCHVSKVAKLVTKGQLRSPDRVRDGSLDRSEVEALAERRTQEREALAAHARRRYHRVDRPDTDHEWLSTGQAAELLGVTRAGCAKAHRPGEVAGNRDGDWFWVRRELLEQVEAARLVRKTRRP